jgi:hypothetical protein
MQELFIACLRHEEVEEAECGRRDRGKEQEAGIGTKVVNDGISDELAERSADADRRADGTVGDIEATRVPREVGDHEER